jgi:hypothetical protein
MRPQPHFHHHLVRIHKMQPNKRKLDSIFFRPPPIPASKKPKQVSFESLFKMATNDNGGATARSVLDEPVDYRDLKAWIAEQEANPRPLSQIQQRAIADLRRSFEPEISDCDWVSLINRTSPAHTLLTLLHLGIPPLTPAHRLPASPRRRCPIHRRPHRRR